MERHTTRVLALPVVLTALFASHSVFATDRPRPDALRLNGVALVPEEGRTRIVVELSRPPEKLQTSRLTEPSRLVIDVHGPLASDFSVFTERAVDDPRVARVRVGRNDRRLRIALDLKASVPKYTVTEEHGTVVAILGEPPGAGTPPTVPAATTSRPLRDEAMHAAAAMAALLAPATASASVAPAGDVAPPATAVEQPSPPAVTRAAEARAPRDPFRPFHLDLKPSVVGARTPLEQYELGALRLVAVIYDRDDPKAMVEDATGVGHSIGLGTKIGDKGGVVKAIEPDRLVVEEKVVDFHGEENPNEIIVKLNPDGDQRVKR
jgi:type IV pilus assembly protein PilP